MILSPFGKTVFFFSFWPRPHTHSYWFSSSIYILVFLHTSPYAPIPELQDTEVASAHWIPLDVLHAPKAKYGRVGIDISTR